MKSYIPRGISCLLLLSMMGCNNAAQPPIAPHRDTEAHPNTPEYQPRESSNYAGNDEHRRRSRRGRPEEQAAPGQFDFYLLNLSWSPEFCATHGDSPECGRNLGFVVHGLWPQDTNGDYPQHCSDARRPTQPAGRYRYHADSEPGGARVGDPRHMLGTGSRRLFWRHSQGICGGKDTGQHWLGEGCRWRHSGRFAIALCGGKSWLSRGELRAQLRQQPVDCSGDLPKQRPASRGLPRGAVVPRKCGEGNATISGKPG